MNSNLKGLVVLLLAISLSAWWMRPARHEWEPGWTERLVFQLSRDRWSHNEKLMVYQDKYQVLVGSGRGALIPEQGTVRMNGTRLQLQSDGGRVTLWKVETIGDHIVLQNDQKFYVASFKTESGMRGRMR